MYLENVINTLSEETYIKIKSRLAFMDEGAFISARGLAVELKISFTPVREALLRLSNEGYLDRVPSVGFFKARMDFASLNHYFESRMMVETFILPKVVREISPEAMEKLRATVAEQGECLRRNDIMGYGAKDLEFHCFLIDLHRNKPVSQFYRNLREQNRTYSKQTLITGASVREHGEFLDLVEAEDYDGAVSTLIKPLETYLERVRAGSIRL